MMPLNTRVNMDAESRGIIYQGASVNQLAELFQMKTPDVMRRLGDLPPIGTGRQGNPIFSVKDAAARLVRVPVTPEDVYNYIRRVNPKDLPPILNKLFWDGMNARERYRENANELWLTEDMMRVAADSFQSLRMSLMLIPDILRDETNLNEGQFKIVQKVIDTALEAARARLVTELRKPRDDAESGTGSRVEDGTL